MNKNKMLWVVVILFLLSCAANAFAKTSGPAPIRNQMPLYLIYLQMEPDKAGVAEQKKLDINAYYTISNVTISCFTPASSMYNINIDAEVSRMTLDLRYGVCEKTELGIEVPYISLSRGYLDEFVEGFEDTVGATTPRSRLRQGSYNYNYSFVYNSQNLISRKNASDGVGDIVLKAKYLAVEEDDYGITPNISFRTAIKLPTGEKDDLLGSGELDYGFGIIFDKALSKKITAYAGCNLIVIEKPSFFSVLNMQNTMGSGMAAIEYSLSENTSFVGQVMANSTPYPYSGTNALDELGIDVGLGVNHAWKEKQNVSWHFAFTENINSAASPDVTFNTGWTIGF